MPRLDRRPLRLVALLIEHDDLITRPQCAIDRRQTAIEVVIDVVVDDEERDGQGRHCSWRSYLPISLSRYRTIGIIGLSDYLPTETLAVDRKRRADNELVRCQIAR